MSSHLGVEKTLQLLDNLKGTLCDFAAREEKLNHKFRARITVERHDRDEAIEELATQLATSISEADASFQTAKEAAQLKYKERKARISNAHKASKREALEKIDNNEGRRKYKLQTETMQTNRNRENGLATVDTICQKFKSNLSGEYEILVLLENTAQGSFKGYGKFLRLLSGAYELTETELHRDENQLIAEVHELLSKSSNELDRFRKFVWPRIFKYLPVWLLILLSFVPLFHHFVTNAISIQSAVECAVAFLFGGLILRYIGQRKAEPTATTMASALVKARKLHDICLEKSETRHQQELERIEEEFQSKTQLMQQQWGSALEEAAEARESSPSKIDEQQIRVTAKNEKVRRVKLEQFERHHTNTVELLKREAETRKKELAKSCEEKETKLTEDYQTQWRILEADWRNQIEPIYESIGAANSIAEKLFPTWQSKVWENWTPPLKFEHAAKFGRVEVDVEKISEATRKDSRLALPGSSQISLPLLLTYPEQGSILFETMDSGCEHTIGALNNIMLRLLSTTPPGKVNFTIIDPIGLGQNFAGIMHLADYEERLINSRIWTQTNQIEQKLADLNEHIERVIQIYLRNEYETIAEYNQAAGNIAEKYHFLVVADFPANFSDVAIKRLLSIAASGARCGVYTLIHWDQRQPAPQDFVPEELRKSSVCLNWKGNEFIVAGKSLPGTRLVIDSPPATDFATGFIHKVGRSSRDSSRVEVPFSHVAPADSDLWSEDTTSELRVAIGRTGATKLQYLAIGKGTRQHALLAGKTGSGKSTLFHVIITNLALWCSPEQVEFYLVDFKKGVEFKCYAAKRLPHARVVAIESDREFGLSVLQRVDDELKRRGDMFRKLGVQDIAGYKRAGGTEPIPRSLLIIDEFQEFFVEDDKVSQTASVLLDRIVRQGRAFGIHVLLGSQTLGGAYTVARTTLGQMVIRIALQCNEADSYLIMDDNNSAPRLLSRPGEGIYNDTAGTMEGNSPFQAVWLSDEVRDTYLDKVRNQADRSATLYSGPLVFEGDAPADVRENLMLRQLLEAESVGQSTSAGIWFGAPNSIKGPTEAVFQKQSGNNLLIVGQRDEATLAILSIALISLAAQYPVGAARFMVCDSSPSGSPQRDFLDRIIQAIPHQVVVVKNSDIGEVMNGLTSEMKKRTDDEHADAPTTCLFLHGLQKINKLRYEEDFSFSADAETAANPALQLNNLICEGTSLGFHVIATCDTYNNVNRFLSRKAFSEFEMRVLFQMSANDSASLIDSPKAGTLGLHRALFYNEQEGYLEMFRPYALPDNEWIEQATRNLARLSK